MLRALAKVLLSITGPVFRRAVSVVVVACLVASLVAGSFASAMEEHHVYDVDGALEELAGTSVALASADVSSIDLSPVEASIADPSLAAADAKVFGAAHDPAQPQPASDHDCHGCAMAVPDAPAAGTAQRLRSTPVVLPARLI